MAPHSDQVFGLTAVDVAIPAAADAAAPSTSALPDVPTASNGTYLTEPPPAAFTTPAAIAAAAAAAASGSAAAGGRAAKALAPMQSTSAATPSAQPPASASSTRALTAMGASPSLSASSRRLPPIGGNGSISGGTAPGFSPDRERAVQALSTPQSRIVTPAANVPSSDSRNFDGRDLHELVKLSWHDYTDVPRVQHIIEVGLSSNTTETSTAEALLQIREASLHNPLFSITPAILELVRGHLLSRNRLLRPAAAYALAGYAANSRHGRGLMTINANDLLPRLCSMLRCKVDSMDARYASLALLTTSMHPEHKEAVGRSGAIPLLINLVRQNVGRSSPVPPSHGESLENLINGFDSERSSNTCTLNGETTSHLLNNHLLNNYNLQLNHGQKHAIQGHHSYAGPVSSGAGGIAPGPHLQPQSHSAPLPTLPPASPLLPEHHGLGHGHGHGGGGSGGHMGLGGHLGYGLGYGGADSELPTSPSKGAYTLHVKPAAAHAVAALVNLAEVPANRQRMRDAGIAGVMEDVLLSRNENVLKERCRLLVDLLQMDSQRFKGAQASAEMATVASVSQAVVTFIQRGKEAKAAAAASAAAAATAAVSTTAAGAGEHRSTTSALGLGLGGSQSLKGSLAWSLARQLERGDEEGNRRAGTVTIKQRAGGGRVGAMSRLPSQAVARAQSHVKRAAPAAGGSAVGTPETSLPMSAPSQQLSSLPLSSLPLSPSLLGGTTSSRRTSGSSGGSIGVPP